MNCCNMVLPNTSFFNVICTHNTTILITLLHEYYGVHPFTRAYLTRMLEKNAFGWSLLNEK